jgi:phosphatidate cytidylyltransferase
MSRNLLQRIGFAIVAIPAALWIIYLGGWPLAALLAVLGVAGTWEVYGLARRQGIQPLTVLGLVGAAAIPLLAYLGLLPTVQATECYYCTTAAHWTLPVAAIWVMGVSGDALRLRGPTQRPLATIAVTVFAPLYASGLLSFIYILRYGPVAALHSIAGLSYTALPLVAMWVCDTAAMAAGTLFGGPKLAPVVSPNKTWAGALAGMVGALAAVFLFRALLPTEAALSLTSLELVLVGVVVALFGQVGDVVESLFKREAGVKDSSDLIPGHGGLLDRLDSLYFAIPATALLYLVFQL